MENNDKELDVFRASDRHDCLVQKKNYERKLKKKELMNI